MVRAKDQFGISGINKGDTKVAGMFGYSDDELQRRKVLSDIINKPGYDPKSVTEAQRQLLRLNQGLSPFDKKADASGNRTRKYKQVI